MNWLLGRFKAGLTAFRNDSLFRNAVFLIASTAIMSVLGFGFWIFVAHLYTPDQIGAASALISITLLISNLSLFGLNAGILRFLPTSKSRSGDINAAMVVVGTAAVVAAAGYMLWVGDDVGGSLKYFFASGLGRVLFLLVAAAVSLNTFTDSIFIASRRAEFHTMVYAVFGVIKLILPILFISAHSLGVFAAYAIAATVSLAFSLYLMSKYCAYEPLSRPNWHFIKDSRRYASGNYVAVLLGGLPSQIMPTLIINRLGSAESAYFSMAWTMANLLYVIPSAINNSLLAESSTDLSRQSHHLKHAIRILTLTLVPGVLFAVIVAPFLLRLFGASYATGGTAIFQILAIITFSIAINAVCNTILNLKKKSGSVLIVQAIIAAVTLSLAWPFMHFGLPGIGLAMLLGNLAGNLYQFIQFGITKRRELQTAKPMAIPAAVKQQFMDAYNQSDATVDTTISANGRGATFKVSNGSSEFVLKIFGSETYPAQNAEAEIAFTDYLKQANIPVPNIMDNLAGTKLTEITVGRKSWIGFLMSLETGHHPHTFDASIISDMATIQARIHNAGYRYSKTQRKNRITSLNKSTLIRYVPRGMSHFDYDGSNILVNNNRVTCVLDFEGMRYDALVICVIFTLSRLYETDRNLRSLQTYLASYQQVRPLTRLERSLIVAGLGLRYRSSAMLSLFRTDAAKFTQPAK